MALAVSLVVIASGTWRWQRSVFHAQRDHALTRESWDHVKEAYPIAQERPQGQTRSAEIAEAVVGANPFSPTRRLTPPSAEGGTEGGAREGEWEGGTTQATERGR